MAQGRGIVRRLVRVTILVLLLSLTVGGVISVLFDEPLSRSVKFSLPLISAVVGVYNFKYRGEQDAKRETDSTSRTEDDPVQTSDGEPEVDPVDENADPEESRSVEDDTETFSSVTKFDRTILKEKQEEVQDWFQIDQRGTIELSDSCDWDVYREMLIYTIAASYAAHEGVRESGVVSGAELKNELVRTKSEVWLFANQARNFLRSDTYVNDEDFVDVLDREFEIDLTSITEAIRWIREPDTRSQYQMDLYFDYAQKCVRNGIETCEDAEESTNSRPQKVRTSIRYETTEALKDVQDCPVREDRDGNWTGFARSADAISDYLEDGDYGSVKHCFGKMEQYLENMRNKAANETAF